VPPDVVVLRSPASRICAVEGFFVQSHAGYDFAKVFDLCSSVEDDSQPMCYGSLRRDVSSVQSISDVDQTKSVCMLGESYEARSKCVVGAVKELISNYHDAAQAKELYESLDADLRTVCLQTAEEYYKTFAFEA
jgi:hypothetical protein